MPKQKESPKGKTPEEVKEFREKQKIEVLENRLEYLEMRDEARR